MASLHSEFGNGTPSASAQVDWQKALDDHQRWLRTVAYSRLRSTDAVDEVMQEVALAAVRQSAPLKDVSRTAPWLYRLTIRQVLLFRRKKGRQRKLADQVALRRGDMTAERTQTDPLEWLLAAERRELVRLALEKLNGKDAEILLLKYTENWSYAQLAQHIGVSRSAVEARLHRARQRLRTQLTMLNLIEATR